MKNKMTDLRNHLFETLEALKDTDKPMAIDRAETIATVAQVLVNTAKVEVDFIKAVRDAKGQVQGTGFIPLDEAQKTLPGPDTGARK